MKPLHQQIIKDTNLKLIYSLIHQNDGISRATLAKTLKLSKTTVSTLTDELIIRKFIIDAGTSPTSSVGRRPNGLSVRAGSYYVIVINWTRHRVNAHVVDITGTVVYEEQLDLNETSYVTLSQSSVYDSILKRFDRNSILGICIVVSAMIDTKHEEIYSTTLCLKHREDESLISLLRKGFPDFSVNLLNDTACYAYAEKVYGKVTEKDFAFINFAGGIGATLFINGNMLGKADGSSTQFGHYSINPDGPQCSCGNKGCLEATIGEQNLDTYLKKLGSFSSYSKSEITYEDLGKAAAIRDDAAIHAITSMAKDFSYALSNLICVVNPKLVIIGGHSRNLGDLFLKEIRTYLEQTGFRKMVDEVELRYTHLTGDAYIIGAMKYFFDIHFSFCSDTIPSFCIG